MAEQKRIPCPECLGTGEYTVAASEDCDEYPVECGICGGSGTILDRRAPSAAEGEERDVMQRAINLWGRNAQLLMLVEECAELAAAAVRVVNRNRPGAEERLCEEVADVEIMCAQIRAMGLAAPIDEYKREKIVRLEARIINEEAGRIENTEHGGATLFDLNGSACGHWSLGIGGE